MLSEGYTGLTGVTIKFTGQLIIDEDARYKISSKSVQ
jgi:hypothetical protein